MPKWSHRIRYFISSNNVVFTSTIVTRQNFVGANSGQSARCSLFRQRRNGLYAGTMIMNRWTPLTNTVQAGYVGDDVDTCISRLVNIPTQFAAIYLNSVQVTVANGDPIRARYCPFNISDFLIPLKFTVWALYTLTRYFLSSSTCAQAPSTPV